MVLWFSIVSSYSVAIAAIAGLVLFKQIPTSYRPFILLLWIGLFVEAVGMYVAIVNHSNIIISNLYVLVESLFLLWQFATWKNEQVKNKNIIYLCIGVAFVFVWLLDNILFHKVSRVNSAFRIAYSIVIVFFGIDQINTEFSLERNSILKNATFLLCTAFISFFAFKAIFEVFYMLEVRMSNDFYHTLNLLNTIFNLIANLIFAIAVLWMPRKRKFLLPL